MVRITSERETRDKLGMNSALISAHFGKKQSYFDNEYRSVHAYLESGLALFLYQKTRRLASSISYYVESATVFSFTNGFFFVHAGKKQA